MEDVKDQKYSAFGGFTIVKQGTLEEVTEYVVKNKANVLVFGDDTGAQTDLDLRTDALKPSKSRGRPKLGVTAREVTLLPRHWEWLNSQPGGASVAIRKLVDEARKSGKDVRKQSQESVYRFMTAICGNFEGYEEAVRALFAGRREDFRAIIKKWPSDVCEYALKLAENAFLKG